MTFRNPMVLIPDLPHTDGIQYLKLDKRYAWLRLGTLFVNMLIFSLGLILVLFLAEPFRVLLETTSAATAVIGTLIVFIWLSLFNWMTAKRTRYALRQHDLAVRKGIFWQIETIQPLQRVQHVELTQGPLDKRFGLATVKLFSAGTGQSTFTIPGLSHETANQLRQYVLDYHKNVTTDKNRKPA